MDQEKGTLESHARPILGALVLLSFILFCLLLVYGPRVPSIDATIIGLILGALGSQSTAVIQFYFGNSSSGEAKDKIISNTLATAQNGIAERVAEKVVAKGATGGPA